MYILESSTNRCHLKLWDFMKLRESLPTIKRKEEKGRKEKGCLRIKL